MRSAISVWAGIVAGALVSAAAAAQDASQGGEIYVEKCQECHGERMVSPGAAFDLRKLGPDERPRFDAAVTNGKGQMPAWGGMLSDAEFDNLWAYIRSRADR
jgi:cytochrome c6